MSTRTRDLKLPSSPEKSTHLWIGTLAALWATTVLALASLGVFDLPPGQPALPTLIAIIAPVLTFVFLVLSIPPLRAWAFELDPVLLTEFQAWRILGGLFLAVYAFGHLPGFFAWPAGLGDVAIGITAPFIAWRLRRNAEFLGSRRFRSFHYLGLLDFLVAVVAGILARNQIPGLVENTTTAAMGQLPLVLIPTFIVPAFIILHLIVIMQSFASR